VPRWDESRRVWRISAETGRVDGRRQRTVRAVAAPNTRAGKRKAEQAEIRLRAEVLADLEARGAVARVQAGSFAELAAGWLERNLHRWSPKTVREVAYALRRYILPRLGDTPADGVTPAQIETIYAGWEARYSPSTVRRWHGIIRAVFADAERLGLIARNPMRRVRPGGGPAPERMLMPSPADVRAVIGSAASLAVATFLELAAATGARRGSLVALRWRDIHLDHGTVTFAHAVTVGPDGRQHLKGTKANRPYAIGLGDTALAALREHRARAAETALALGLSARLDGLFVFSADGGQTHWSVHYPSHAWLKAARRAGVAGIRLHDLRHFAATRLLAAAVPPRVVADRLGCTEANVIRTYSHRVPSGEDARAAQILDTLLAPDV
jgi:integrase